MVLRYLFKRPRALDPDVLTTGFSWEPAETASYFIQVQTKKRGFWRRGAGGGGALEKTEHKVLEQICGIHFGWLG